MTSVRFGTRLNTTTRFDRALGRFPYLANFPVLLQPFQQDLRRLLVDLGIPVRVVRPDGGRRRWHENAALFELLVDANRGTLLRFAAIEQGAETVGHEVT